MFKNPEKLIVKLNNVKDIEKANILFILPGLEGNCDAFKELSDALERKNVQMFGLQFTENVPYYSLEEAAQFYIKKIDEIVKKINLNLANKIGVCGYSFGGLLAIEICHQMENKFRFENDINFVVSNLILLESSHSFFRAGVYHNCKKFGKVIPNKDIFADNTIYTATLSIYISAMIGKMENEFKFELYDYLKSCNCFNLDEAIQKAFDYIISNNYYLFENELEVDELKRYTKLLMLKSNAGFIYNYNSKLKLKVPTTLIKTNKFMYRKYLNDLFYLDEKTNEPTIFNINEEDYSLKQIADQTSIIVTPNGNHWTFISENVQDIAEHVYHVFIKNKLQVKSKI